ncbi:hypothetical protein [Streptomyces atrovirens]|uniref:Transposase n=1 Tax=Streptomyces atrovirens TaxID=285556 RepID=A0ABW0DV90_9ACTN
MVDQHPKGDLTPEHLRRPQRPVQLLDETGVDLFGRRRPTGVTGIAHPYSFLLLHQFEEAEPSWCGGVLPFGWKRVGGCALVPFAMHPQRSRDEP